MTGFAKFLVGAAATSLLAWGAHALTGEDYIGGLQTQTQSALDAGGMSGVSLAMANDPLARIAVLSGVSDPAERARIEAAVMAAVPGLAGVRWADGGAGEAAPATADVPPAAAAVAACQDNVDQVMTGKVINFNSSSAFMPDSSLAVIDEVANAIRDCAGMPIAVEGHTDATGSADINQRLSQARADAVAAALAERGIAAARVTATGFGSSRPVDEGSSDVANAANRRIEFKLGSGGAAPAAAPAEGE